MSDAPRLSVVMPMRNCGHCVCAMLDSLRLQNIPMQIIIIDDASEDDGPARVEAWSRRTGQAVELLRNDQQLYSYGSRLKGLARAMAPVIWNVDADDIIPPNADVRGALDRMEREQPDILHARACGIAPDSSLQKPLLWTEPIAANLHGEDIFRGFLAQAYPPATIWNKFFSARLVKAVLDVAPDMTVRYFDVKFLGLLLFLCAQRYVAGNELLYEYRMRAHRPSWLYARQVDALQLMEQGLAPVVAARVPDQVSSFRDYCRRRLVIQAGHLSLMAEAELQQTLQQGGSPRDWLAHNILVNISCVNLCRALYCSLGANAARLHSWSGELLRLYDLHSTLQQTSTEAALERLLLSAREWLCGNSGEKGNHCLTRNAFLLGRSLPPAEQECRYPDASDEETALALLLGNARLARTITAIMAPDINITKKAN